jgi:16S rRNA (guanine966-N2)-methyltransferase
VRIVAGKFRGKNLLKSDHLKSLRPTTDKNREALFNILLSAKFVKEIGFKIDGANVLDVCCGSGAVGFEALSRGAKSAVLIENFSAHLELAKKNSVLLKVENDVEILSADAKRLPRNEKFFDLVFIDPPYAEDYAAIVKNLLEKNWIQKNSLVVVEFKTADEAEKFVFENLKLLDLRRYGKTSFGFFLG